MLSPEAVSLFQARVAMPPRPAPAEPEGIERATTMCEMRRYREALAVLERIVRDQPENSTAWTLIAQARLGRRDHAEALEAARTACRLVIDSEPQRLATVALIALERYEEAAVSAAETIRLDPGDWRAYVAHAEALIWQAGRLSDARASASTAVQLAPHEVATHLIAGQIELADGDVDKAADSFRRVLGIDPSNTSAFNELARMHLYGWPLRRHAGGRRRRWFGARVGARAES